MTKSRVILLLTCLVVAGLGGWFAIARWDEANRVATCSSALASIAAVGVAVWATFRAGKPGVQIGLSSTGNATAQGGFANSGIDLNVAHDAGNVKVRDTGSARATKGGVANTGFKQQQNQSSS
jgi:hypothetical protein